MAPTAAPDPAEGTAPDPAKDTAPGPATLLASIAQVDKRFGSVQALQGLNIDVPRSKVTVLLGPNGAGKTTAIRMITGAMAPDQGTVTVFGVDPTGPGGESVRRRCGVVTAKPSLYDRLSGLDNLRYAAELYDLGRGRAIDDHILATADQFGIADALDQLVGGYSTGMKTRLALARAVLHDPQLLLLDEPTSGLDPESAVAVLAMVREMTSRGRTVVLCTHLLIEAEGLADEIVVMQDGTSLMWGQPDELAKRYWPRPEVDFAFYREEDVQHLVGLPGVTDLLQTGAAARVELSEDAVIGHIIHWLSSAGVMLRSVVPYTPTLEELYFAIRREHRIDDRAQNGHDGRPHRPTTPTNAGVAR